jgi:hypothetical protein
VHAGCLVLALVLIIMVCGIEHEDTERIVLHKMEIGARHSWEHAFCSVLVSADSRTYGMIENKLASGQKLCHDSFVDICVSLRCLHADLPTTTTRNIPAAMPLLITP